MAEVIAYLIFGASNFTPSFNRLMPWPTPALLTSTLLPCVTHLLSRIVRLRPPTTYTSRHSIGRLIHQLVGLSPRWCHSVCGLWTCRPRGPGSSCSLPPSPAPARTGSAAPGSCASSGPGTASEGGRKTVLLGLEY